jgi:hypothetical protein
MKVLTLVSRVQLIAVTLLWQHAQLLLQQLDSYSQVEAEGCSVALMRQAVAPRLKASARPGLGLMTKVTSRCSQLPWQLVVDRDIQVEKVQLQSGRTSEVFHWAWAGLAVGVVPYGPLQ